MKDHPVVLITGASSGIGAAAVRAFAQAGYRVALAARREARLKALAEEVRANGGEALVLPTDVTQLVQIETMVKRTLESFGRIDVLLNNAGMGRIKWLEELRPQEDVITQVQLNLTGAMLTAQAVLPTMIKLRSGHIINMSSMAGQIATPTYSVYAATKFGLGGFTQALRREVGVWGIQVSAIYPGGVDTEFASHLAGERKTGVTTPRALLLSAEDVAQSALRIALGNRSRQVVLPPIMRVGIWFKPFFPWFDGLDHRAVIYQAGARPGLAHTLDFLLLCGIETPEDCLRWTYLILPIYVRVKNIFIHSNSIKYCAFKYFFNAADLEMLL